MDVLLATSSPDKAAELRRILAGSGLRLHLPAELGLPALAVDEPGPTFADNAALKARAYLQAYRISVLADDSGLRVDALAGAPGVRSHRFGGPGLDDAGRVDYLLQGLSTIPPDRRTAHYTCSLALARPDGRLLTATGHCYGYITEQVLPGPTGFGYDPVFYVPSFGTTVARLDPQQKDLIGHRGRAARALLTTIRTEAAASGTLVL